MSRSVRRNGIILLAIGTFFLAGVQALEAAEVKVKPIVSYGLTGSIPYLKYSSLSDLVSEVNRRSELLFQNCIKTPTYSCSKFTITDTLPSGDVRINGEPLRYILPQDQLIQSKNSAGNITVSTGSGGGLGADVHFQCPKYFSSAQIGAPSDIRTMECTLLEKTSCPSTANPIQIADGIKFFRDEDYRSADGLLSVERIYRDQYSGWVIDPSDRLIVLPASSSIPSEEIFGAQGIQPYNSVSVFNRYTLNPDNPSSVESYTTIGRPEWINSSSERMVYLWQGRNRYRFVGNGDTLKGDGPIRVTSRWATRVTPAARSSA